jgi:hypothetical protein
VPQRPAVRLVRTNKIRDRLRIVRRGRHDERTRESRDPTYRTRKPAPPSDTSSEEAGSANSSTVEDVIREAITEHEIDTRRRRPRINSTADRRPAMPENIALHQRSYHDETEYRDRCKDSDI